ncbi:MAG: methyltransferase family protein [Brevundimonas sp.]
MTATPLDLRTVQLIRKAAVFAALIVLIGLSMVTQSIGGVDGPWHEWTERAGLAAIILAIVGRAWCSLYIGGRKKAEIVARGPYSVSRNPLYVFSFIGAFGMGAQTGSVTVALLFVAAAIWIFRQTVRREEGFLSREFGEVYARYVERTPRFGPDFRLWRDEPELTVRPEFFLTTLRDGLMLLVALPVFELIDKGQSDGWLRVLLHLP